MLPVVFCNVNILYSDIDVFAARLSNVSDNFCWNIFLFSRKYVSDKQL